MALNKTEAASEPGNVGPSSPGNIAPAPAPRTLTEAEYDQQHQIAPNPNPYRQPGIIPRLMAGLSGAFATLEGNRAGGQALIDRYLNQQQALKEADQNYPQTAEEARHKQYMETLEGPTAQAGIRDKNASADANEALAQQRERDRETLEQQYANAIGKGDKAGAANLLGAIKDLTTAQTKETDREGRARTPYDDWRQENPDAPVSDWLDLQNKEKAAAPRSSGRATPFSTWRSQNPNSPIEDWFKVSKGSGSEHDVDALEKERDAVSRSYNAKLYDVAIDPTQTQEIRQERDARIKTYDRLIHNAQNGYSVGSVIDTPKGKVKITGIRPDGMLEVVPAGAAKK